MKIIKHEFEDRLDLLLGISGIVSKSSVLDLLASPRLRANEAYPFTTVKDLSSQIHRSSSDSALRVLHETMVEQ